jgi:hypothetical protein
LKKDYQESIINTFPICCCKLAIRKAIQLAIIEADAQLEALRGWIIRRTNYHINGMQHRLFLLSMWVDRRLDN